MSSGVRMYGNSGFAIVDFGLDTEGAFQEKLDKIYAEWQRNDLEVVGFTEVEVTPTVNGSLDSRQRAEAERYAAPLKRLVFFLRRVSPLEEDA